MTGAPGQAASRFAFTLRSCTHGVFLHVTFTVWFFVTPAGLQSFEAVATTAYGTCEPEVQAGIVYCLLYGSVAPAATTWLNTWSPLMVTTMVSGSSEQFCTVPEIVTASPGQAEDGSRFAVSTTH